MRTKKNVIYVLFLFVLLAAVLGAKCDTSTQTHPACRGKNVDSYQLYNGVCLKCVETTCYMQNNKEFCKCAGIETDINRCTGSTESGCQIDENAGSPGCRKVTSWGSFNINNIVKDAALANKGVAYMGWCPNDGATPYATEPVSACNCPNLNPLPGQCVSGTCSTCGNPIWKCSPENPNPEPYCGDSICNDGSSKTCEPNGNTKDMKCINNVYTGDLTEGICRTTGEFACTYCGDGLLQTGAGEQCDDGNRNNGDGCNSNCQTEILEPYCGDSICNDGSSKTCEPNGDKTDYICANNNFIGYLDEGVCRTTGEFVCTYCGDGILQTGAGEECDDGNNIDNDGCSNSCKFYQVPEFSNLTYIVTLLILGFILIFRRK
ncbi:MAG: DUF4215 domain-containing protein [Candidatus Woesearchaeota archaeon]